MTQINQTNLIAKIMEIHNLRLNGRYSEALALEQLVYAFVVNEVFLPELTIQAILELTDKPYSLN